MPRRITKERALKRLGEVERKVQDLQEERKELLEILAGDPNDPKVQRSPGSGPGRPRNAPGTMVRHIVDLIDEEPGATWTADLLLEVLPMPTSKQSVYNALNRLANSREITQVGRGQFACNKSPAARRIRMLKKRIADP